MTEISAIKVVTLTVGHPVVNEQQIGENICIFSDLFLPLYMRLTINFQFSYHGRRPSPILGRACVKPVVSITNRLNREHAGSGAKLARRNSCLC